MSDFALHERLAADTRDIGAWDLSLVRLMNARQWPWLVLVPRRPAVRELADLGRPDRAQLMEEIAAASHVLRRLHRPDKLNIGALGNLVPQLHVHIIGRFIDDPAWPGPVWGSVAPEPYEPETLERRLHELRAALLPWPTGVA
jgi:diadenosine tetraphosphate (Ap4A) HIT family hydrolase